MTVLADRAIAREQRIQEEEQKLLAVANKFREQAKIQQETAKILLEKSRIDAEAVKVAADAEAYKKKEILTADNALAQKLEAEIAIQSVWADAYSKRQVPLYVFGGSEGTPTGNDSDTKNFMQLMTVDAAKRLSYSRGMGEQ